MLKKFLIHKEGGPPVGDLVYDTDKDKFTLTAYPDPPPNTIPVVMEIMLERNMPVVKGELALCFVRERLVPPERANIAQILADLRLPYYDEVLLLEAMHGRCVMDDCLVTPTYMD